VIRTLAELALSLALGSFCALATAKPILLWSGIAVQSVVNLAIRSFCAATDRAQDNWLTASTFAFGSLQNIQIIIHEICHASAALCLLQSPSPTIKLIPYFSGITSFRVILPTDLGNQLGVQRIQPLITAAGPAFALLISSLQLTFSLKLLSSRPTIARTLIAAACINFIVHAGYALSARWSNPWQLAHDFVELKAIGLNPLYASIAILAIPIIIIGQAVWKTPVHPKSAPSALLPCRI
jgi:hypothetical protein